LDAVRSLDVLLVTPPSPNHAAMSLSLVCSSSTPSREDLLQIEDGEIDGRAETSRRSQVPRAMAIAPDDRSPVADYKRAERRRL
jgi:hypothetical protein